MNILIIGNIASGKSALAQAINQKCSLFSGHHNSIDGFRKEISDGTLAGEFRAWAEFLEVIQNPNPVKHETFEFSGTGKNTWFVKEAIRYSKEKHNAAWRVVFCSCDSSILKERAKNRQYDIPIPYNFGDDISKSIKFMSDELSKVYNTNFWRVPEMVVQTDKKSAMVCADEILLALKDSL